MKLSETQLGATTSKQMISAWWVSGRMAL